MNRKILRFDLDFEIDVVLAHKRAIQIAELTWMSVSDQTRFATAVSEISRNCIEHAKKGNVIFSLKEETQGLLLEAEISDNGPGIDGLDAILSRSSIDMRFKGVGILSSRKLVDTFDIVTDNTGTRVRLGKRIPPKHPPLNNTIIEGWRKHFQQKNGNVSPYEEIKHRNMQLLQLADELKAKKIEADLQVEEIKKLNNILESKNDNLKQVAYTIAHDLKNPITTIKLACEMGLKFSNEADPFRLVELIEKNSNRLLEIIDGLQKSIDDDPDIALPGDQINLKSLADELLDQFNVYLEQGNGKLVFDFKGGEEVIYPKVYLYSILSNLISNSIKYASDKPLELKVSGSRIDNLFLLKVADNGIGMDLNKDRAQLFRPFSRLTKQGDGKGMGLSIVHYIITRNGGDINVESTPGKGTIFYCYLKEY